MQYRPAFLTLVVVAITLLPGCEGYKRFNFSVVSKEDGRPLPGAQVFHLRVDNGEVVEVQGTDSLGQADYVSDFGGLMFGYPKIKYKVSALGYADVVGYSGATRILVEMEPAP